MCPNLRRDAIGLQDEFLQKKFGHDYHLLFEQEIQEKPQIVHSSGWRYNPNQSQ